MHLGPSIDEFPGVAFDVCLVLDWQHHDRPHGPVEIVQNHTCFCLLQSFRTLLILQGPLLLPVSVESPILASDGLDFVIGGPILKVVVDARGGRVSVVAHPLVQVVSQVVVPWVPPAVLEVDEVDLGVVCQLGQDVILLCVVVREYEVVSLDKASQYLLVPCFQVGAFKQVERFTDDDMVWVGRVQLRSDLGDSLDSFRSPFVDGDVDAEVGRVEWIDGGNGFSNATLFVKIVHCLDKELPHVGVAEFPDGERPSLDKFFNAVRLVLKNELGAQVSL